MVHAYEHVRCTKNSGWRDCHDEYFATKIDVIHQRALRTLGINAIGKWETYRQSLWFKNAVDESYINRSPGTYGSSRHDDHSRDGYGGYGSTNNDHSRDGYGGYGSSNNDHSRDGYGGYGSTKTDRCRRDEPGRSRIGNRGGVNPNVGAVACSVM